jgi:hypothetical protein
VTNAAPVTWSVDAGGTPGLCEASDTDGWHALPTSPTPIASTTSSGQTGNFTLVFGIHAGASQAAHSYVATFDVEVMSPAL